MTELPPDPNFPDPDFPNYIEFFRELYFVGDKLRCESEEWLQDQFGPEGFVWKKYRFKQEDNLGNIIRTRYWSFLLFKSEADLIHYKMRWR